MFKKCVFLSMLAIPFLFPIDMTVSVHCNGMFVRDVSIQVFDWQGEAVAGVTSTDSNGQFVIANTENYVEPFRLFFTAPNGSSCGAYPVISLDGIDGEVHLCYYPKELPCSCSKLVE